MAPAQPAECLMTVLPNMLSLEHRLFGAQHCMNTHSQVQRCALELLTHWLLVLATTFKP